jgi:hypothetical protein
MEADWTGVEPPHSMKTALPKETPPSRHNASVAEQQAQKKR